MEIEDKWNIIKSDNGVVIWKRFNDRLVNIEIFDNGDVSISNITNNKDSTYLKFTSLEQLIKIIPSKK